jgi:hypothetical protein
VQIPDDTVQIAGDTLSINLNNVAVVDQLQFPGGTGNVPAKLSFDITYTKSGQARNIVPTSSDPLSAFHWAGRMWAATNSGTLSVAYDDGSFSASGNFSSSGNFGEMGTERNGVFINNDDLGKGDQAGQDSGEAVIFAEPAESMLVPAPLRTRLSGIVRPR